MLIEENNLRVDESVLTGESREISKKAARSEHSYGEENMIFMGTFVIAGRCRAKIVHTGMNTRFGAIASMISETEKSLPLQQKLNKIARFMVIVAVVASFSTGLLMLTRAEVLSYQSLTNILILTLALAVSAFPEGLPAVLITTLAVGARRMAKKNAIVNRMSIIETLGETTVICTDKTGTLTSGEMTVKKIYLNGKMVQVSGSGYEAAGEFSVAERSFDPKKNPGLTLLLKTAVICNDSRIKRTGEDHQYKISGTPTEGALMILAAKAHLFREDLSYLRVEEIPFTSDRKMMSVLSKEKEGNFIYAKGAPEILLAKCHCQQINGKCVTLNEAQKEEILKENAQLNHQSYRTLALAYKKVERLDKDYSEDGLIWAGLVGMEDPPREEVAQALQLCQSAGISVKMVTGDHQETALAIASQIGLSGKAVEGTDLDQLTDEELAKVVNQITIFSRVRPEHKLRIVKALQAIGEIVTMTGDGVNDAPALKEAHIGVAMGKNGTDVSRSVADLTLKDDNFATIVEAIKEGRSIFNNIRKFVSYQLACNWAEILILFIGVLLSPFLGWQAPLLLALQILFMNLVTDDLPAITLGLNRTSKDVMRIKPRRKAEIFNRPLFYMTIGVGVLMAFLTLTSFYISFNILGQGLEVARTTALVTLILLEIAGAFSYRSFRQKVLTRSPFANIYLVYASVISVIATLVIVYSPLSHVFETTSLDSFSWFIASLAAIILVIILDLVKNLDISRSVTQTTS
ncbi:MAG: ATPase, P-type (Transporting), HAD superfamily, subfamily IC [Candidatus Daviesbacteria bacterium GW2011_GWC1_40_9]|nr:MAG: ATPase, P-type (Transporting), HAD superfamily, subfamily IC [Candidatus Daviesbacteria bacterium GW2011_GWC1_40_9]